jgi:5-methylcytosine-specific restriction endonuclease McrA
MQTTNCKKCGEAREVTLVKRKVHWGFYHCYECYGSTKLWAPKPDSDKTKYKRSKAHRDLVKLHSAGFCELCLLKESQLPAKTVLHAHHVIPYENGGSSDRSNLWIVCDRCHALVDWVRTTSNRWTYEATAELN